MAKMAKQSEGKSASKMPEEQISSDLSPAYGNGPFTRPLPRPTGCWAGCIRTPCCLTNRPDQRSTQLKQKRDI